MCFKKIKSLFKKKQRDTSVPVNDKSGEDGITLGVVSIIDKSRNENETKIKISIMQKEEKTQSEEFSYLEKLIRYRLKRYFPTAKSESEDNSIIDFDPISDFPPLDSWYLPWEKFAQENNLTDKQDELTILLIGITPHIQPDLFDKVIGKTFNEPIDFPNIGGARGKNSRFFLPTGETVLFLLAGDDFKRRIQVQQLFGAEHIFWEKKAIWLEDMQQGEPAMHGKLIMSPDYIDLLTYGIHKSPQFSISFPAKKIAPEKETDNTNVKNGKTGHNSFDKLVIPEELKAQIDDLENWLKYHEQLTEKFDNLRQGYRTLFYGPPGTGKTFTAKILGNKLGKEVYKIDLSMIVSKYIGETEKNLELLFARAEDKGWILFFDEADALFGKRTNVRDAHDKYANQEVSYLLQRIEDYNGLVILATNMKNNIDEAFMRRFNSVVKFPFPDPPSRARIWEIFLPKKEKNVKHLVYMEKPGLQLGIEVDIPEAVKKYELSGGSIMNVIHYAGIKAVERYNNEIKSIPQAKALCMIPEGNSAITMEEKEACNPETPFVIYLSDVLIGIKQELIKEGKPFTL